MARRHPLIQFRVGPSGRRAALVGGAGVWEVISGLTGGDVPSEGRLARASEVFGLAERQVEAALAYYAEFTDEIDAQIEDNRQVSEAAETLWRRRRDLLRR